MENTEIIKEKIRLIDHIMNSLCTRELNYDGRVFINKLRDKLQKQLDNELAVTKDNS